MRSQVILLHGLEASRLSVWTKTILFAWGGGRPLLVGGGGGILAGAEGGGVDPIRLGVALLY